MVVQASDLKQKLEKLQGKTKKMEAQVKEAVESKKKLEDELNAIRNDKSERNEEEDRTKKELEDLKGKNALLETQNATHKKDLEAVKAVAADDKKVAMLDQEKVTKAMEDRFEKERGAMNQEANSKFEKLILLSSSC